MTDHSEEKLASQFGISVAKVQAIKRMRGLTDDVMVGMSPEMVQRLDRRLQLGDLPHARTSFRRLQERDESGQLAYQARAEAVARKEELTATTPDTAAAQSLGPWKQLGPGNIGGRTRSIVIHPTSTGIIWAGSVGGGIWRSTNSGSSWTPVNDRMGNLAVCCMLMDPTNPNIIYAGTGEGFYNLDAIRGAGIFRTTDGTNWSVLPPTAASDNFRYVNRIAISKDGKTVLAATSTGLFRSTDPASSWPQVMSGFPFADVKFHPTNPALAVAATLTTGTAYHSIDGGQTWNAATHSDNWGNVRVELAYAKANPSIVYASVNINGGEIWRSSDGGKTYVKRNTLTTGNVSAQYLGGQGWYDNVIWAGDPTNADFVIVGGIDLWRSTDGGNMLKRISYWGNSSSVHADHHAIVADPGFDGKANKRVYFGNDGGIFKTDNVQTAGNDAQYSANWTRLNNGYAVTQFYAGAGNPKSQMIIGGAQDNGTLRGTPSNQSWTGFMSGDGGWCAADQTDPNYFYGEYVYLNIFRSGNGAQSGEYICGLYWNGSQWAWKPAPYQIPDAAASHALFIAPFVLDPNNSNRILAGGASLWRTGNARQANTTTTGPSWAAIKDPITSGSYISALAVASGNSDVVWVGYANGEVWKTANATATTPSWSKLSLMVGRYCANITIDPTDSNTVYVTYGGYVQGNIHKTTSGGTAWTNIGQSLTVAAPVRALAIHPKVRDNIYAGTEVGLFVSSDGGVTWGTSNQEPTNCSVDDLFWLDQTLVCVTHGRGMWSVALTAATASPDLAPQMA